MPDLSRCNCSNCKAKRLKMGQPALTNGQCDGKDKCKNKCKKHVPKNSSRKRGLIPIERLRSKKGALADCNKVGDCVQCLLDTNQLELFPSQIDPCPADIIQPQSVDHSLVIGPQTNNGSLGFISADIPDNTSLGGNCRGVRSVDFQMSRLQANQVAGGDYSAIVSGQGNLIAPDTEANFIGAGSLNGITGANKSAILAGENLYVLPGHHNSSIIGGSNFTSQAPDSANVGGQLFIKDIRQNDEATRVMVWGGTGGSSYDVQWTDSEALVCGAFETIPGCTAVDALTDVFIIKRNDQLCTASPNLAFSFNVVTAATGPTGPITSGPIPVAGGDSLRFISSDSSIHFTVSPGSAIVDAQVIEENIVCNAFDQALDCGTGIDRDLSRVLVKNQNGQVCDMTLNDVSPPAPPGPYEYDPSDPTPASRRIVPTDKSFPNTVTNNLSVITAGNFNTVNGNSSFIGAGGANTVSDDNSMIGAGTNNRNFSSHSAICAGRNNRNSNFYSFIGAGTCNTIQAERSSIVTGSCNFINASADRSGILAGQRLTVAAGHTNSVIVGGSDFSSQASESANVGGRLFVKTVNQMDTFDKILVYGGTGGSNDYEVMHTTAANLVCQAFDSSTGCSGLDPQQARVLIKDQNNELCDVTVESLFILGPTGADGADGPQGPTGNDGKSGCLCFDYCFSPSGTTGTIDFSNICIEYQTSRVGSAVSISGDYAIVGDINNVSAFIFKRSSLGSWNEIKTYTVGNTAQDAFGRSVAIDGDVAIVSNSRKNTSRGEVHIFQKDLGGPDNWGLVKIITPSVPAPSKEFGWSVSISGNFIVVGTFDDEAYIFEKDLGGVDNWGERKLLTGSDTVSGDEFGQIVSINGNRTIIGAKSDDDAGSNSGSAYIFEKDFGGSDNWGQRVKLTASDAVGNDVFGISVSIYNDMAVVGAINDDDLGRDSGSAYIFYKDLGGIDNWGELKKINASDGVSNDRFGHSVSIYEDQIIVSSDIFNSNSPAYIFEKDLGGSDNWGESKILTLGPTSALRHQVVSIYANLFILGPRSGSTRIYETTVGELTINKCDKHSNDLTELISSLVNSHVRICSDENSFVVFRVNSITQVEETFVLSVTQLIGELSNIFIDYGDVFKVCYIQGGNDGMTGLEGPEGPTGPQGIQGPQGYPGPTGQDGSLGNVQSTEHFTVQSGATANPSGTVVNVFVGTTGTTGTATGTLANGSNDGQYISVLGSNIQSQVPYVLTVTSGLAHSSISLTDSGQSASLVWDGVLGNWVLKSVYLATIS